MGLAPNSSYRDHQSRHRDQKKPNTGPIRNLPNAKTQNGGDKEPDQARGNKFHGADVNESTVRFNPETAAIETA
jgi:hypothetical protein